jgi:H+-transporting ATPase
MSFPEQLKPEQAKDLAPKAVLERLAASREGLSAQAAAERLDHYGPNELPRHRRSALLQLLGYFWGPIPWMIEIAALLSLVVRHFVDLAIVLVLLVFNAAVGFWEEHQAQGAVDRLQEHLAPAARARRDGVWTTIPARELVPGDLVKVHIGQVVPADLVLLAGDKLSVDQSALTGESLTVHRGAGEVVYSGSVVKGGEMEALVSGTGAHTYLGRTAELVDQARPRSHFQQAVLAVGRYLIYMTLGLVAVLLGVGLLRQTRMLELAQFALILTVAAIPVAMPAVLSVTMAAGAMALSRMKAIVTRLESIEEMAGVDVLCSDKTGTLTKNQLTVGELLPAVEGDEGERELLRAAALATREDSDDAIDRAVLEAARDQRREDLEQAAFVPFDPVHKRTEATVRGEGETFKVTKGAPQVVLALCERGPDDIGRQLDQLAARGYRALGVARTDGSDAWRFLGLIPLYDPPRDDARETLAQAREHGIEVKMVTGDNVAIGREIAAQLGLGRKILPADALGTGHEDLHDAKSARSAVERANGFAEVFPEHKYTIIKELQERGHLVGMTGDGVNDAPALKQADVGIAVSGATDAARGAAALVLTEPGLSVIVRAVEQARRIFSRMTAYTIYRITETVRIMFFMVAAMIYYGFYPITAVMIILLALLNDLPIMAIAYDRTRLEPRPVRWDMRAILAVSSALGGIGLVETFGLLYLARSVYGMALPELQSLIFLKLVVAGHLTLLVARTRGWLVSRPRPAPVLLAAVLATQTLAALMVGLGWFVAPLPWTVIGLVWAYCLAWVVVEDAAKRLTYRLLGQTRRGPADHRPLAAQYQSM